MVRTFFSPFGGAMVQVISPPRLLQLPDDVPGSDALAVLELCRLIEAPPTRLHFPSAVCTASACFREALTRIGPAIEPIGDFAAQLSAASETLRTASAARVEIEMAGLKTKYPAWAVFTKRAEDLPRPVQRMLGAELILAVLLKRQFRRYVASRADEFVRELQVEPVNAELAAGRYADRLVAEAARTLAAASVRAPKNELLLCSQIVASLVGQLDSLDIQQRQAGGTLRELTDAEHQEASKLLRKQAEAGDVLSLAIIVAYCVGLPWDISLDIPFAHGAPGEWVAQIDISAQVTRIDLEPVFPELARAKRGHVEASQVLVRPMPQFVAELLVSICAASPGLRCMRDLPTVKATTAKTRIPGTDCNSAIAISIARFIATRSTAAIRTGVDRTLAAYVGCDLTKIGGAKNHYVTIKRNEIWEGCQRTYCGVGWGPIAASAAPSGLAVGSMITPTVETVLTIEQALLGAVQTCRAGRRYSWESLKLHHNAYALFCAHRTAFFTCARKAETYQFLARDFVSQDFALLVDKRTGPVQGGTPIPMPAVLSEQVRLWRAHLRALARRLEKLDVHGSKRIRERLDQVFQADGVPMFFQLDDAGILEVGSSAIFSKVPEVEVNHDAYRHYVPNALRRMGVPSSYVDAAVRHFVDGISLSRAGSCVTQLVWLTAVAHKLDELALHLGFRPVPGLCSHA
jgi:hypothetical protein